MEAQIQTRDQETKYWCFECQLEINKLNNDRTCTKCNKTAVEQITDIDDPRQHDVYDGDLESEQPQIQLPRIQNVNSNQTTNIINELSNNRMIRITPRIPINIPEIYDTSFIFQRLMGNGDSSRPATAQQIANLQKCYVQQCCICLGSEGQGLKLECNHVFHNGCIKYWLQRKDNCPTCRAQLKKV